MREYTVQEILNRVYDFDNNWLRVPLLPASLLAIQNLKDIYQDESTEYWYLTDNKGKRDGEIYLGGYGQFNGTNNVVSYTSGISTTFDVSVTVKMDSWYTGACFFSKGNVVGSLSDLVIDTTSDSIRFFYYDTDNIARVNTIPGTYFPLGEFITLRWVYTGEGTNNSTIYINGEEVAAYSAGGTPRVSADTLYLGSRLVGNLKPIQISGATITDGTNTEAIFDFEEQSGTTIYDKSGNGNHATVTGTITSFWQESLTVNPSYRNDVGYNTALSCTASGLAYSPSEQAYGTWEFSFTMAPSSWFKFFFIKDDILPSTSGWNYNITITSNLNLILRKGGTALFDTASGTLSTDTLYRVKIVREIDGEFFVYIKGDSFGEEYVLLTPISGTNPVTDNEYTSSVNQAIDLDTGDFITNMISSDCPECVPENFTTVTGAYDLSFIPAKITKEVISDELVTNGEFESTSNWTLPTGSTVLDGELVINNTTGTSIYPNQVGVGVPGSRYEITVDISERTAGTIKVFTGSGSSGKYLSTTGVITYETIWDGSSDSLVFVVSAGDQYKINSISVKEVTNEPVSSPTVDVLDNALQNKGKVAYPAQITGTSLLNFNGTDNEIIMDGTKGINPGDKDFEICIKADLSIPSKTEYMLSKYNTADQRSWAISLRDATYSNVLRILGSDNGVNAQVIDIQRPNVPEEVAEFKWSRVSGVDTFYINDEEVPHLGAMYSNLNDNTDVPIIIGNSSGGAVYYTGPVEYVTMSIDGETVVDTTLEEVEEGSLNTQIFNKVRYGPELITNGTFDGSLFGWNAQPRWEWVDGRAHMIPGSTDYSALYQLSTFPVGSTYRITFDYEIVSGSMRWRPDNEATWMELTGTGSVDITHTSTSAVDAGMWFANSASQDCDGYIDNVVAKIPNSPLELEGTVDANTWTTSDTKRPSNLLDGFNAVTIADGTENYISTGLEASNLIDFEIKCSMDTFIANSKVLGVRDGSNYLSLGTRTSGGDKFYGIYGSGQVLDFGDWDSDIHTWNFNGTTGTVTQDGVVVGQFVPNTFVTTNYEMFLFAENISFSATNWTNSTLYYCKIWDNGELVRDYIPHPNGKLLEAVSGELLSSVAGTFESYRIPVSSDDSSVDALGNDIYYTGTSKGHNGAENTIVQPQAPALYGVNKEFDYEAWYGDNQADGAALATDGRGSVNLVNYYEGLEVVYTTTVSNTNNGAVVAISMTIGVPNTISFKAKSTNLAGRTIVSVGDNSNISGAIKTQAISSEYQTYKYVVTPTQETCRLYFGGSPVSTIGDTIEYKDIKISTNTESVGIPYSVIAADYETKHLWFNDVVSKSPVKYNWTVYSEALSGTDLTKAQKFFKII